MNTTNTPSSSSSSTTVVADEEEEEEVLDRVATVGPLAAPYNREQRFFGGNNSAPPPGPPGPPGPLDPLDLLVPILAPSSLAISEDEVTTMTSVTGSGSSLPATIDNNDTYI